MILSGSSARKAWVALGSNLCDPAAHIEVALREMQALPGTRLRLVSSLYRSAPMDAARQPDYCNAVVQLHTALAPVVLMRQLHGIESAHGRRRDQRWASRTLDCDLLIHEQDADCAEIELPHPGLLQRAFVLIPLAEIAPGLQLPDGRSAAAASADFPALPAWQA